MQTVEHVANDTHCITCQWKSDVSGVAMASCLARMYHVRSDMASSTPPSSRWNMNEVSDESTHVSYAHWHAVQCVVWAMYFAVHIWFVCDCKCTLKLKQGKWFSWLNVGRALGIGIQHFTFSSDLRQTQFFSLRPLYIPYQAVATMENFSISSNVTVETGSSSSSLLRWEICFDVDLSFNQSSDLATSNV